MTPLAWAMLALFVFVTAGNLYFGFKDSKKNK